MKRFRLLFFSACLLVSTGCTGIFAERLFSAQMPPEGATPSSEAYPQENNAGITPPALTETAPQPQQTPTAGRNGSSPRVTDGSPLARPLRGAPLDKSRQQSVDISAADSLHRDETLAQDTHWQGNVVVEGSLIVPPHVTLTVAPGTTVRFRSPSPSAPAVLLVQGRLEAKGTADRPVAFLPAVAPALAGDWQGIVILGSDKRNLLEQCRIEGATTALDVAFSTVTLEGVNIAASDTGLRLQESLATVHGGAIADTLVACDLAAAELEMKETRLEAGGTGILATASSLFLARSDISGNNRCGIAAADCRILLDGNSVIGNGCGIYLKGGEGTVKRNRIDRNRDTGLHLSGARLKVMGNDIADNGRSGMVTEDNLAVAWGNSFQDNRLHDLEHRGTAPLRAMGNWWQPRKAGAPPSILSSGTGSEGNVLSLPHLPDRPLFNGQH